MTILTVFEVTGILVGMGLGAMLIVYLIAKKGRGK